MVADPLENDEHLTQFDFEYLKGNDAFWDVKGSAFNSVYEWCRNNGYGAYGKPTHKGKKAMEDYERKNMGSG